MDGIIIRKATFQDSAEIPNVHINSWREAYAGLINEEFLNDGPLFFKKRYELWRKITINSEQSTFIAESDEHGIVGFINGTNGRDKGFEECAEVRCLYLLEKYQGKKIGFHLLKIFFNQHIELGFKKGYLWVLKNNPSISFYECTGGKFNEKEKTEKVGRQLLPHLCYEWESLKL
ncbi:MAG: GNAT family N-acetyltransferase [Bacteriovoracaceae bacterium]|jgi:GNAT superfamily N-acetyltransferase|nr:GNAT family N-acetyltransferase [Bacteriovoracaceae bacterium]